METFFQPAYRNFLNNNVALLTRVAFVLKVLVYAIYRVCHMMYVTKQDWYKESTCPREFLIACYQVVRTIVVWRRHPAFIRRLSRYSFIKLLGRSVGHVGFSLPYAHIARGVVYILSQLVCDWYTYRVEDEQLLWRWRWYCAYNVLKDVLPLEVREMLALPEQKHWINSRHFCTR